MFEDKLKKPITNSSTNSSNLSATTSANQKSASPIDDSSSESSSTESVISDSSVQTNLASSSDNIPEFGLDSPDLVKLAAIDANKPVETELLDLEIQNLENQKPVSLFAHKPVQIVVSVVVLFVLVLSGVLGYIYLLPSSVKEQLNLTEDKPTLQEKIVIEDEDPQLLDEFKGKLVYEGNEPGTVESVLVKYYSPTLDVLFQFSREKYNLRENLQDVSLYFNQESLTKDVFGRLFLLQKATLNNEILDYLENQNSILEEFKVLAKESQNQLKKLHFFYKTKKLLASDKDTLEDKYKLYLIREFSDQFLVLELTYGSEFKPDEHLNNLQDLLTTAVLSPKIDQEITVLLKDAGLALSFDRVKWENKSKFSNLASFVYINKHELKEIKYPYTHLEIKVSKLSPSQQDYDEQKFFEKIHKPVLDQVYSKHDLKYLDVTKETLGEFTYQVFGYTYFNKFDEAPTFGYIYLAKLDQERMLEIKVISRGENSNGAKDAKEVIKSLKKQATQATTQPVGQVASNGRVLGTGSLEIDTATILARPATVRIFNRTCLELRFSKQSPLTSFAGKTEKVCTAALGTGFFVNKDGYVMSNSHVMTPNKYTSLINTLEFEFNKSFWNNYATAIKKAFPEISVKDINLLVTIYVQEQQGLLEVKPIYENFAAKNTPFRANRDLSLINQSNYIKLELIDTFGDPSKYEDLLLSFDKKLDEKLIGTLRKQDIALARIVSPEYKDYPFIELEDPEVVTVGEPITVIGFPANADNDVAYSEDATLIPTITKGVISAIKPNPTNEFKILQFDAAISGGNSGGPVINSSGKVVALATWDISPKDKTPFNGGSFVAEAHKLIQKNNVKIVEGEYNRTIRQALSDFAKKDYVSAKQNFQKAATIYPPAAEILSPLIKISQNKINSGESVASVTNNQAEVKQNNNSNSDFDSSQIVDFITENRMLLTVSLGSIIGLLVVVLIIALIAAANQKKKQEQERLFRLQQLYQQRQMQMQMQAMGYSGNYPTSPNYPQNYNYPYTN